MESVAENTGPETVVRPPKRKPGTVPSKTAQPLSDGNGAGEVVDAPAATEAAPRPEPVLQPAPKAAAQPAPQPAAVAPRPAPAALPESERRYRQTIHRVDLWSVLKISVCFYICGMAVTMVALVALWLIADAAGVIHSVENFFGDLLQTKDFTFLDGEILRGALLVAAVLVVLQIVITVIAAAFYNVFAELFGGVEITISEDESAL
jgi:hypothetical protein